MKNLSALGYLSLIALVLTVVVLNSSCEKKDPNMKVVAITQIIEHPALDKEREGLLGALKDAGYVDGKNLKVIYLNAQGNMATATQIAQKIASIYPDVAVGISTPSSQTLLSAIGSSGIPMLFTAVTDPVAAKLVSQSGASTARVTGVSDYLTPESQLEMVRKFVPHLKRLGFVYNPGEVNSLVALEQLKNRAGHYGVTIVPSPANSTGEIPSATTSLVGKVEAIYVPTDNTAVASIQAIVQIGIEHHIPVFAADIGSIERGAIAMAGYDRIALGRILGQMAVKILKGGSPKTIPVAMNHPIRLTINKEAAEKMRLPLPSNLPGNTHYIQRDL